MTIDVDEITSMVDLDQTLMVFVFFFSEKCSVSAYTCTCI